MEDMARFLEGGEMRQQMKSNQAVQRPASMQGMSLDSMQNSYSQLVQQQASNNPFINRYENRYEDPMRYAEPGVWDEPKITATPVGHRTPEEIQRQMEKRLAEMEEEAKSPKYTMPCSGCKYVVDGAYLRCKNPLVMGLEGNPKWAVDEGSGLGISLRVGAALCGPEKALWRPKDKVRWKPWMGWVAGVVVAAAFLVLLGIAFGSKGLVITTTVLFLAWMGYRLAEALDL